MEKYIEMGLFPMMRLREKINVFLCKIALAVVLWKDMRRDNNSGVNAGADTEDWWKRIFGEHRRTDTIIYFRT